MHTLPETILVPIDFNDQSMHAMKRSYDFARFLGLEIVLLYVFENQDFAEAFLTKEELVSRVEKKLKDTATEIAGKTGLKVTPVLKQGKVYNEILKTAKELNSKYILMGTNDSAENVRIDKNQIGSNTSKIIRQSPIPVITVNGKQKFGLCHNILLPLDLTKETRHKVTYAVEIARRFGAGIRVVSVLWSKKDKDIKNELLAQLDQVKRFIEGENIRCTSELIESEGGEKMMVPRLLQYVEEQKNIDLIMIMTQQENKLVEYFLGSAAQSIIRLSQIPVMSITPFEFDSYSVTY
ncbi:MAG: universal stress protein [Bacteroidetes bacterium]|jgi:nucleotide-binding universal stress UspA family protein|nr:universal stress protein [Bacteroidota bacterium]